MHYFRQTRHMLPTNNVSAAENDNSFILIHQFLTIFMENEVFVL
jgi:hypothetical protein